MTDYKSKRCWNAILIGRWLIETSTGPTCRTHLHQLSVLWESAPALCRVHTESGASIQSQRIDAFHALVAWNASIRWLCIEALVAWNASYTLTLYGGAPPPPLSVWTRHNAYSLFGSDHHTSRGSPNPIYRQRVMPPGPSAAEPPLAWIGRYVVALRHAPTTDDCACCRHIMRKEKKKNPFQVIVPVAAHHSPLEVLIGHAPLHWVCQTCHPMSRSYFPPIPPICFFVVHWMSLCMCNILARFWSPLTMPLYVVKLWPPHLWFQLTQHESRWLVKEESQCWRWQWLGSECKYPSYRHHPFIQTPTQVSLKESLSLTWTLSYCRLSTVYAVVFKSRVADAISTA